MNMWSREVVLLCALVLVGAAACVLHVALWLRTLRAPGLPRALRIFSFLPPLTAVAGFLGGAPVLALLWCIVVALYIVLRSLA